MFLRKETAKGFIDIASLGAVVNVYGQHVPASHTVSVAEYGRGISHHSVSGADLDRILSELRA